MSAIVADDELDTFYEENHEDRTSVKPRKLNVKFEENHEDLSESEDEDFKDAFNALTTASSGGIGKQPEAPKVCIGKLLWDTCNKSDCMHSHDTRQIEAARGYYQKKWTTYKASSTDSPQVGSVLRRDALANLVDLAAVPLGSFNFSEYVYRDVEIGPRFKKFSALFDSGAVSRTFIAASVVDSNIKYFKPYLSEVQHKVVLGYGKTSCDISRILKCPVRVYCHENRKFITANLILNVFDTTIPIVIADSDD
jgi:hypothetical protein